MEPVFFSSQDEFRSWLEKNHHTEKELLVGFYKVGSGKPSMTWSESVDQALCYGWIDGVRKSIDSQSYQIRFTPRKPASIWSSVNIKKIDELKQRGLMNEAGLVAFSKMADAKSEIYSYEREPMRFSKEFEQLFRANAKAWDYFQKLAPSYQKSSVNWVMSAKQDATRQKRILKLISDSELGTNEWKNNKYIK